MATLEIVASRIQDLYEQNFAPNDRFLDIDDIKFQVAAVYSDMLNKMYQMVRSQNKQQEGFANIEIPPSWLIKEKLKMQAEPGQQDVNYVTTTHNIYSFDWDNNVNALQDVFGKCVKPCVYRKISLSERKFMGVIPPTSTIYFYVEGKNKIVFYGGYPDLEVTPEYVPQVLEQQNDCIMSDNIVSTIVDTVLERMFKAKSGNFIQKADNQNANVVPQQQADPALKM